MHSKQKSRQRRALRLRKQTKRMAVPRLCMHRTPRHIYVQLISASGSEVLASASTLDKDVRTSINKSGNAEAASIVGTEIAKRAIAAGIKQIAFDRSGFKYHGRIKALADAAREAGMEF